MKAVDEYFAAREKFAGEKLIESSPFLRNMWDYTEANGTKRKEVVVQPFRVGALRSELFRLWIRAGVRENTHQRRVRKEFKGAHGLRKFFKTQA